ncbi:probable calcium-binding protein CML48 [Magnolia sinica]|uniref:probable calcium-binding protein CML48 n=1 Tax=Magnolia sinica TaxID=86752 RepID=UPI002659D4DD|nr:probable calcium-binding protein CML48 [Magnolia sinica]
MNYSNRFQSQSHSPSAPPLPESSGQQPSYLQRPPGGQLGHSPPPPYSSPYSSGYSSFPSYGGVFPPGTHPDIIRSFQAVDRDRSGFIDEKELQAALSTGYQKFSLRTIRLLIFLFKNPNDPSPRVGPSEFAALWNCLGQWRAIFERFDRDRSGEIDSLELRDALLSLGYAVPPSVLQVLMSKYDDRSGRRGALNFDSFVECGMIVKGLTEKFKQKDPRYTGTATLTYDTFMSMIIPFIAS